MSNWDFYSPCKYCNQLKNEDKQENGCVIKVLTIEGEIKPRHPYVQPFHDNDYKFCHDCGVTELRYHHPGCDMELCPNCHGQLISCPCELDDKGLNEDVKIPFETIVKLSEKQLSEKQN